MMNANDQPRAPSGVEAHDDLDLLLARHFQDELDGQLGRTPARFAAVVAQKPASRRRAGWVAGGAITGIAALLAIALLAADYFRRPADSVTPVVTTAPESSLMELERTVAWQTFDEGTVLLDDKTPMRRLRREVLERVQYYDPTQQALVEMTIPKEEVFLVELAMY
jgi:hypothetical protein